MIIRLSDQKYGQIKIVENAWTGKRELFVNEKALKKINNYTFEQDKDVEQADSKPATYRLEGNTTRGLDLIIDGHRITVLAKISMGDYILCALPLVLIFFGGAVGGGLGGLAFVVNVLFTRRVKNFALKLLICLISAGVAIGLWYLIALAIAR